MDALIETLNAKLRKWKPETASEVRERVSEIISLADQDVLGRWSKRFWICCAPAESRRQVGNLPHKHTLH